MGEGSVAEGGGVAWGAGDGGDAGSPDERRYAALMERLHQHQAERGDHAAHVQLRYAPCLPRSNVSQYGKLKLTR